MGNQLGNNGGRTYSFLNRPVLIDCNFVVDSANGNGLGIRSLKGAGVRNVFMHTTATAGKSRGMTNPNPAAGFALIQLDNNYNRYAGGFCGAVSPISGSPLAINATALTAHNPYTIVSVGHAAYGAVTIAPVADIAGSLASTYFKIFDAYGNTYVVWFSVSGVGKAPSNVGGILVQQSISTGDSAATIGAALATTLGGLFAAQPGNLTAPSGVYSFTTTGTTTVTVTSTVYGPLPGVPQDSTTAATGFTFAQTVYATNNACWQGVGLPAGITPAVGATFIAKVTGFSTGGTSTGLVEAPLVSGIGSVEVIGDPNATLSPTAMGGSPNVGGMLVVQFLSPTDSSTTTPVAKAPADGSVVGMSFYVEAGSIIIDGE